MAAKPEVVKEIARLKRTVKNGDEEATAKTKLLKDKYATPLDLMLDAMNQPKMPFIVRIACAKDAMPYCHARIGDGGKKGKVKDAAHDAANRGKFKPKQPPEQRAGVVDINSRKRA